ncbi:PAAR domain-containing protein [Edwardsiella anguillarum]|uniref:PAAR domain-containing protein n=1 Tax=Edwardsiella anguillarum TaxID=1821960 RepID=UPI0024B7A6A6|nr:PAAR domain-containing protein [Edwardsiella anguillarum]WHP78932.1 PAAR domain-containing protein [Edwardsiella anguillarum]
MPVTGYYLVQGDKTTCGGRITTGAEDHTLFDKPVAREQDSVTCGKYVGLYRIAGGIDNDTIHGRRMAGTLDSYSTCPCKARFIPSMMQDTYEKSSGSGIATNAAEEKAEATVSPAVTAGPEPCVSAEADKPDEQLSGWLAYYGTDMQPLKNLAFRSFVDSDVPKVIIAGDGHRKPPFIYSQHMPGVLSAFSKGKLRLYVEYTQSGWSLRNKTPGALPPYLTQKKSFFKKDIVTPWENEVMGESSTAIYEKLIEKIGGLTPLTAAEAKKLKLQGQQFADGLNAITPDLAVTVRKHINNLVAAAGSLPEQDVMALVSIISGQWRDLFVNEDLAERLAEEITKAPDLTRLISIGDAHLDDNNNPFHILLAEKLSKRMKSPPVILVNKRSEF